MKKLAGCAQLLSVWVRCSVYAGGKRRRGDRV